MACLACLQPIPNLNEALKCTKCSATYHFLCLNITSAYFEANNQVLKKSWQCDACTNVTVRNERRRGGDKDNTPVTSRPQARTVDKTGSTATGTAAATDRKPGGIKPSSSQGHICLSKDDIQKIIQTELRNALSGDIVSLIKECLTSEFKTLKSEFSSLKSEVTAIRESMEFIDQKYDEIKQELNDKLASVSVLQKEIDSLREDNKDLKSRLAQIEQHSRSANLELQCVPEYKSENVPNLVSQLAKVVSYDLKEGEIRTCTRTAKINSSSPRPRAIIIQMNNALARDNFLAAIIKFNKNNAKDKLNSSHLGIGGDRVPVYASEHLSPTNKELHKLARLAAKEKQYKYIWVRGGRILVRKNDTSPIIVIKDQDCIKKLL
ncbi:hypothetical protein JYU34_012570 [Plutella xylostella]|uniref:PHD-type domain-containing protein n=1 Tax=Plutella xylostella TaxID=51655 RepID=A0ABQ7QBL8_PLUXY|nr:hypothetical protein JYU34_012570 [Plutella xylostella]